MNAIRIPRGDLPAWEADPQNLDERRRQLLNAQARR